MCRHGTGTMKARLSFRGLIVLLYLGSLIPLLTLIGLVVYRSQQNFLITDANDRLTEFVRAGVTSLAPGADLTNLSVVLGEHLRVLGADLFIKDADGRPVPPALGTGPWLDAAAHRAVRETRSGSLQTIPAGSSRRLVYLVPILDAQGNVLGTVEASLPLDTIESELSALRRWLIWIMGVAAMLGVLLSFIIARVSIHQFDGLLRASRMVAQGNLSSRAPLPQVSEARDLTYTFNDMLDRIQSAIDRQARLTDEMRRFATDASHELRSPLAVLRNGLEMLEKARRLGDEAQVQAILGLMNSEVDSMTSLVDNLLFLARLDQADGRIKSLPNQALLAPLPLLEEVYERAQMLATGQILCLDWPDHPIAPVLADHEMMRRALNNLVENALHYTPTGREIHLRVEADQLACRWIVQDQGCGMQPEQMARVFERFYRGDQSRDRPGPGAGLGLPIVAAIAKAHGGTVHATSRPGEGTVFTLELPFSS
jgi:two-component system, OmpR family, sensor kinase